MTDLQDVPATPPEDFGGDDRVGFFLAGGILIALGWGAAVLGNLLVHSAARAGTYSLGPVSVTSHLGPFAWATLIIGLLTGALGVGIVLIGRRTPAGPWVLPGGTY